MPAACRNIQDRIGCLSNARQKLHKQCGVRARFPVTGIARVEMEDGCAGLDSLNGSSRDLIRRDRKMRAHRGGMNRTRHRTAYDDLRHAQALSL